MALQHFRSSTAHKRPDPTAMADGQIALNTAAASPGLFYKDSAGDLVKVGPVHVGATAPNVSPASGGTAGNSKGEQWLDTSGGTYVFKIWDGSAWRSETGTFVDVNGDTMTGALGIIAGSASTPGLFFSGDTNTGIYSPGADQVAISTNGTGRLFVDSSGNVGVGVSPGAKLQVNGVAQFGATGQDGTIQLLRSSDGGAVASLGFISGTTEVKLNNALSGPVTFYTNNTERLRITSDGKVGLGTSSPSSQLDVRGSADDFDGLRVLNTNSGSGTQTSTAIRLGITNSFGAVNGIRNCRIQATEDNADSNNVHLDFYTNSIVGLDQETVKMRLTSGGNLGVGTTGPNYVLDVRTTGTSISSSFTSDQTEQYIALKDSGTTLGHVRLGSTSGSMLLFAGNGERARIDSSGRLLVGTSSSSAEARFIVQGGATGSGGGMNIQRSVTTASAGSTIGFINFTNSSNNVGATVIAEGDGTWSAGTSHPTRLVFSICGDGQSSPTERMRISADGLTRTYGDGDSIIAATGQAAGTTFGIFVGRHSATSTTTGTNSFIVYTNGNVVNTNNSYGSISDIKLKENILDANSQWNDLKALRVRKYNFKEAQTHTQIGLIAQEVELVSPGLVSESPDRDEEGNDLGTVTKSVNYSVLYMKAVKALQEAMERIEQLESEMAAVKAQLA